MLYIIASVALIGSLTGMGVILVRKSPELKAAKNESIFPARVFSSERKRIRFKIKRWYKTISESFSWELVLQRVLSWVRITALKVERKAGEWLSQIRERTRKKKEREAYWKRLSRLTKKKDDRPA